MRSPYRGRASSRLIPIVLFLWLLTMTVMLSGCGGDTQAQQQASQKQTQLDQLLRHARQIGVPSALLGSVVQQEQAVASAHPPFSLFNDQPTNTYYQGLSTRYEQLSVQVLGIITSTTDRYRSLAQQDVQNLQVAVTQQRAHGLPVQSFSYQLDQYHSMLAVAREPKDYALLSNDAHATQQSLTLMQTISEQLTTLKHAIDRMQTAHLDVTVMSAQYQSDQQKLASIVKPLEFEQLGTLVDAQYQQAIVNTTQAVPFISAAKLSELEAQFTQLQSYGIDSSAYQKRLNADRAMLPKTSSIQDYITFSKQIDADMAAMHGDLLRGQATALIKQFHSEVSAWTNAHMYHDPNDGVSYPLDAGYMSQGIGDDLDNALAVASTTPDFQSVVDEANGALFNLHMMKEDYTDHTPYNQVHATDTKLLNQYSLQKRQVLMVSLVEQAMRVYQNGKLVNSFLITGGRAELPALPGVWTVLDRLSPTTFKSPEPKGSPYWYPDTPIHYAIMYHAGGYFVHDSWWRADYGPGTQFPHTDSGGDQSFAGDGSHGCINMQEQQAQWVYDNTDWNTMIVIY
jgi:L,D-transpeptidase catalytic domain